MVEAITAGLHKTNRKQIENVFVSNRSNSIRLQKLEAKYRVIPALHWREVLKKLISF